MPEKLLVLKDFLSLEKEEAVNYDFKREVFKKRGLEYNNENMINNILLYKGNIFQSEGDCDRIDLTLDIYNKLWKKQLEKYCYFDDSLQKEFIPVNGETMNSFTRIYKIYTEIVIGNGKYEFNNTELNRFAKLTHSLGNFIPVCANISKGRHSSPFNSGRNLGAYDYWDLTMWDIKNHLDRNNNALMEETYQYKYIKNSSYWLNSYKNWNEFCKSNYLDNWASNEAIKNNIYWESHIQKRQDVKFLKNDIDKFNLILKKINDLILYRGRIMYDELNKLI